MMVPVLLYAWKKVFSCSSYTLVLWLINMSRLITLKTLQTSHETGRNKKADIPSSESAVVTRPSGLCPKFLLYQVIRWWAVYGPPCCRGFTYPWWISMIRCVFTTYLPKHDPRIHGSTSRYEPHAHAELLRPELWHTGLSTKSQNCHCDELLTHARTLLPTSLCDPLSPHYLCHLYANRPSDRYTCMKFWCTWAALIYICIVQLIFTASCVRLLLCVSVTFVVMLHFLLLTVLLRKPVVMVFVTTEIVLTEL